MDQSQQQYHNHEDPTCARVGVDIDELVILFEHHYAKYLRDQWMFFVDVGTSGDTLHRANEILDLIAECDASCRDGEESEVFRRRIIKNAEDKFFGDKDPLWVKVFKSEATFVEEVKVYQEKIAMREDDRVRDKRLSDAYAAVVTDRFARHGRFVKDGARVFFEHNDGRYIEVTEYTMQESHTVRVSFNPTPEQEREMRELGDTRRAMYEAHTGSPFEALMLEILGDNASRIGTLGAIATLAAAAKPKAH